MKIKSLEWIKNGVESAVTPIGKFIITAETPMSPYRWLCFYPEVSESSASYQIRLKQAKNTVGFKNEAQQWFNKKILECLGENT